MPDGAPREGLHVPTRIDELLQLGVKALVLRNLLLDSRNLDIVSMELDAMVLYGREWEGWLSRLAATFGQKQSPAVAGQRKQIIGDQEQNGGDAGIADLKAGNLRDRSVRDRA